MITGFSARGPNRAATGDCTRSNRVIHDLLGCGSVWIEVVAGRGLRFFSLSPCGSTSSLASAIAMFQNDHHMFAMGAICSDTLLRINLDLLDMSWRLPPLAKPR